MAQANIVREPSMDEILASIRRIIESNDPIPAAGLATIAAEPDGFSGEPANDDAADEQLPEIVELTVDAVLANREAEIEAKRVASAAREPDASYVPVSTPERVVAKVPEPAPKPLSLADVAARVRAASERNAGQRPVGETPAGVPGGAPNQANPLNTGRMAVATAAAGIGLPQPDESRNEVAGKGNETFQARSMALVEQLAHDVDAEMVAAADIQLAEAPAPVWPDDDLPEVSGHDHSETQSAASQDLPLVSGAVSDQVARSFGELAVAVEMAERRSFDEIAAELLRPMLQEWLDDNLPTLVERLVREEIERVARGPRR